jgi:hypothetical protein
MKKRKEIEIDVYRFKVKTDTGTEMIADSRTKDIENLKKELKENYGYGSDRIKSIRLLKKMRGLVWA